MSRIIEAEIDERLAIILDELAKLSGKSFSQVVNDALTVAVDFAIQVDVKE